MSVIYLVGEYFNILNGAESVAGSSEHSLRPASRLYNGLPGKAFQFNAAAADDTIDIDANRILNGDMEDWSSGTVDTPPDNWNLGTIANEPDSVDREGTIKNEGTYSCKLTTAGGTDEFIYQDITVLSGWYMSIHGDCFTSDGAWGAHIRCQNLHTGQWLTSLGEWQSSKTAFVSDSTGSGWESSGTITFMVEPYSTTMRDACTLRIYCAKEGGGAGDFGYFDDVACWPHVNFASIHGHNLGSMITPKLQSDTDSAYGSVDLLATMTVSRPSFFEKLGDRVTDRFYRILNEGTNFEAIKNGELVLAQYQTLTGTVLATSSPTTDYTQNQSRTVMPSGEIYARKLSDDKSRSKRFGYFAESTVMQAEIHEIYERSNHGVDPIVFVPVDTGSVALYGKLAKPVLRETKKYQHYFYDLEIIESPFALSVA